MDLLTPVDFDRFARFDDSVCVSLLMPTHPAGMENLEDPIRFKNLLKQARAGIADRKGPDYDRIRDRLEILRDSALDGYFWKGHHTGMAVYCRPEETYLRGIPFPTPERVVINSRCYLAPLVPAISAAVRFRVLALSPKSVRLFDCSRYSCTLVDTPGWPNDLRDIEVFVEEQRQVGAHAEAASAGRIPSRDAVYYGQEGFDEGTEHKQRLLEYCRLVDRRLHATLGHPDAPLVLACDERLAPIFRETTVYPRVVPQTLLGNPDYRTAAEIHEDAWKLVKDEANETRDAAVLRYGHAIGHGMAATGLKEVLPAAHDGRIDTLLVAEDSQQWGKYDIDDRTVDLHKAPTQSDEELVNLAVIKAYVHGAAIFNVPTGELPDDKAVAAVLRY